MGEGQALGASVETLRDAVLRWAGAIRSWDVPWCSGPKPDKDAGIYPSEMAGFLGLCDFLDVGAIVEFGRGQHGYSTQILGEYAERTGMPVVSIDREVESGPAEACRRRLQRYKHVRCVSGDAFVVLPDVLQGLPDRVALLVDGPKKEPANWLSLAASQLYDIRVVAHHNSDASWPWGRAFARLFPSAFTLDALQLERLAEWQAFKVWEAESIRMARGHEMGGRALDHSSLAMATVPPGPHRLTRLVSWAGGLPHWEPLWLWWRWKRRKEGALR